jgi:hypothetical protein
MGTAMGFVRLLGIEQALCWVQEPAVVGAAARPVWRVWSPSSATANGFIARVSNRSVCTSARESSSRSRTRISVGLTYRESAEVASASPRRAQGSMESNVDCRWPLESAYVRWPRRRLCE